MCSELLRIPLHYGSVPLFGFGIVLAVWLLVAGAAMWHTAAAFGWGAAIKAHGPTAAVIAAAIIWGVPKFFPQGLPLRGYGVMVLAGSIAGVLMALHRARQDKLPTEVIFSFAAWLFLGGILGARLFYIIEYWDSRIHQATAAGTIAEILKFTEGGLVVYGAFFGAVIAFLLYVRRRRLPLLAFADLLAPSLLAGLALGRIGCFLNGCCYGGESTLPWAVTFPRTSAAGTLTPPYAEQAATGRFYGLRLAEDKKGVVIIGVDRGREAGEAGLKPGESLGEINGEPVKNLDAAYADIYAAFAEGKPVDLRTGDGATHKLAALDPPPRSLPVQPAQLYSSLDAALLTWFLWSYYPFRRREGEVTALMLLIHPVSRFMLEIIRVDEGAVFGTGLSISQNISIGIFVLALVMWAWLLRRPAGRLDFPLAAPLPA